MGIEIERKFLVTTLPSALPRPQRICQGYICDDPGRVVRVRTMDDQAFLTVKGKTRHHTRPEYEYAIPPDDARQMLDSLCLRPLIEKERYTIGFQGFSWVVDQFSGENQGLVLAEIELETPDQFVPFPPWIGREVSQDPRYFNSNLIAAPYATWPHEPERIVPDQP